MKKILFLQIKGNALGGIWFVNKTLGEAFLEKGFDVSVLGFRNNVQGIKLNTPIKVTTINEIDRWEIIHRRDVVNNFGKKGFFKTLKNYFIDNIKLKKDYRTMQKIIREIDPDYIIASHYQTLHGIPKEYLKRTIHVQHSTFRHLLTDKQNVKTLKKLNKKIFKLAWLCETTKNKADEYGFNKNVSIYNPNKFSTEQIADVVKNKKIVVISRIHSEKRIDLMIEMVNDVFKNEGLKDWSFEIYGMGTFNENSLKILKESNQIFYKGVTDNVVDILMNSSITLNTSTIEGFPLSIIEGYTCGLPVISLDFGESVHEEVINGYNGYVIENDDIQQFKQILLETLLNEDKLKELSKNAKEFSKQFKLDGIVLQWEELFNEIDKNFNG